jgi:hypothetical protein
MDVCLLCVMSGRVLCDELITRPEESYRLWRVAVCDQEISCDVEVRGGLQCQEKKTMYIDREVRKFINCIVLNITFSVYCN